MSQGASAGAVVASGPLPSGRELAGLAGLAVMHELSNLLAVASSSAWLAGRTGDDAARVRHLERVERHIRLAQDVLAALSAWSRGEPLARKPVEFSEILDAARTGQRQVDGTSIELSVAPFELVVVCEPILFGRAVANLVANAVRATASAGGGRVLVRARVTAEGTEVEVADEGPGTTAERAFGGESHEPGGHGVGLVLTRAIVEAHGGRLELRPSARGARFAIVLPAPA